MPIVEPPKKKRKLTKKDFILNKTPIPRGSTVYNFANDVKKHTKTITNYQLIYI